MHVLVGVEVRGLASHERGEGLELIVDFAGDRSGLVHRHDFVELHPGAVAIHPLAEVDVEPHAQLAVAPCILRGLVSRRPSDHEARTGDDAVLVRLKHAPVHADAPAEVIGIDDQHAARRGGHSPRSSISRVRTVSARKYSSAIARAARLWRSQSVATASKAATASSTVWYANRPSPVGSHVP